VNEMIEKAKAENSAEQVKEQIHNLKKVVKQRTEANELALIELKLREDILEHQKKYPKPLNANFEFENVDKWSELLIRQWELEFLKQKNQINAFIEENKHIIQDCEVNLLKMEGA